MKYKKEIQTGLLAIAVLVAAFFTINYLRGADIFGRDRGVIAYYSDIEGLVESAPVMFRGYAAGRVDAIEYDAERDSFAVYCSVDRKFNIPSDSRLVICSSNIMGGKSVRIDAGTSGTPVTDGGVLPSGSEPDAISSLSSGLGTLLAKAEIIMDSLETTVGSVNAVLGESNRSSLATSLKQLEQTLANLRDMSSSLGGKSGQIQKVIDNIASLSERLVPIADSADSSLSNIEAITRQLSESDLRGTVADVDTAVRKIGGSVEEVADPLGRLVERADSLVGAIMESPKKYVRISLF